MKFGVDKCTDKVIANSLRILLRTILTEINNI